MAAGSVVVELLAKTGSFVSDIDRAAKNAEKSIKDMRKRITESFAGNLLNDVFQNLTATLAKLPGQILDGIDALNDVADATGASIENISALEDVAVRTGASLDTVSSTLVKFNNVLKEADGKNGASLALEQIGLNAEELKRIDPAEALRQTAVALSQFADDGNKARIIQELFGKSVKEAAPFLKDLAEQGQLNAKVTAEQAAEAERFNKSLFDLQKNVIDIARDISGPLVKSLNEVIQLFKDGRAAGKSFLDIGLDNYAKNVREFYGMKQPSQGGATGSWGEPVPDPPKPSLRAPALPGANSTDEVKALAKAEADRQKALDDGAKRTQQNFASYLDNLKRQQEQLQELTALEKLNADVKAGKLADLSATQIKVLAGEAKQLDAMKAQEEANKAALDLTNKIIEANQKLSEEGAAVFDKTRTPLELYLKELERLNGLLTGGKITQDTFTRATQQAGDAFVQAGEKIDETGKKVSTFADEAARNIQDALGDTLEDALSGNFDSIGDMWLKLLQKMAAQALAAQLNEALFSNSGSSSSGGTNWLSSLFSAWSGSANGSHANGLDYVPFDGYKAILHKGERVVTAADNRQFDSAGGGMGATFDFSGTTYNVGSNVSLSDVRAAVEQGRQQTKAEIARSRKQEYAR